MPTATKTKKKAKSGSNTRGQYFAKTITIGHSDQKVIDQIIRDLKIEVGPGVAWPDSMIIRSVIQFYQKLKKAGRVQARDILG